MKSSLLQGILRRLYRRALRVRLKCLRSIPGRDYLLGYNFVMEYPDAFRWASQVVEVFDDDCYRIGRLPQMPRVVDVGANVGTFSLAVLWHRPKARLIVIEPSPLNLGYLEHNLDSFGTIETQIVKAAVGVSRGTTQLAGDFTDSYRTGVNEGICVQMFPLSDFLKEKTDLLKIDIEGAELDALKGAGETLANVDRVVIEYHDYPGVPSSLPELLQLLKSAGFDSLEVDSLRRFPSISPELPIACCLVHGMRVKQNYQMILDRSS